MLALGLAGGVLVSTTNAQRGYGRDYARGARGFSKGYQNNLRVYQNYTRGYSNLNYRPPVIIQRVPSPVLYGPRYYGVPRGSISITFGGNPYFYFGGSFYKPFGGYYRSIMPPPGIRIGMLPPGYIPILVGPDPYYYYNGTYYRRYDDRSYQVVDAPMGAQLSSLPEGAKSVTVNGEKFYELNGTYYKKDRDAKGRAVYTVVGKNGEIENTEENRESHSGPKVGDRVAELPSDSKMVTLNNEKFYVGPDDTYYRSEPDGTYTVVGVASPTT